MAGIFNDICNFDNIINNFNTGINNTISGIRATGFEILTRFDEIIVKNGEEFINHTQQFIVEELSRAGANGKEAVLDVIEQFTDKVSKTAESIIENAKNATMGVLDESLEKIRHEADIFVEHILTGRFLITLIVFILIVLFSGTICLFHHLSNNFRWCSQLFVVLSNMLLVITSLLAFTWFGFALVSFFERAIASKDPFYIVGTIILFFAVFYGVCHLCWILKTKIPVVWKWLREGISNDSAVSKHNDGDTV